MAEPPMAYREKTPEQAAGTIYSLLASMAMARPDDLPKYRNNAIALITMWKGKKEFADSVGDRGKRLIEGILRYGDESSLRQLGYLWELIEKTPIAATFKQKLGEFSQTEMKDGKGTFHSLYEEYLLSPLAKKDCPDCVPGEISFFKFLQTAYNFRAAELILSTVSQGKADQARKMLAAHKDDESFMLAFAWKSFGLIESVIAKGDRAEARVVTTVLGMVPEDGLSKPLKEIFDSHIKGEKSKYFTLYSGYLFYAEKYKMDLVLSSFLTTMCDVHEAINEGRSSVYPGTLVLSIGNLSGVTLTPVKVSEEAKKGEVKEIEIESTKKATKKTVDKISKSIADTKEFINEIIKDPNAKARLNAKLDGWAKKAGEWDRRVKAVEEIMKKEILSPRDVEILKKMIASPDELKYFIAAEYVKQTDIDQFKQLAMYFVNALMSGSQDSADQFNQRWNRVNSMKSTAPLQYYFCVEFIGAMLQEVSPEVYTIVKTPDVRIAIQAVLAAPSHELAKLRALYGTDFVNFIVANRDDFNNIYGKAGADTKIAPKYESIITAAKVLFTAPEDLLEVVGKIAAAMEAKDDKALQEFQTVYGNDFVNRIKKDQASIVEFLSRADVNLVSFAGKYPELVQKLKETNLPAQQEALLNDMQRIIKESQNFRNNLDIAFKETSDKEMALIQIRRALNGYRQQFGSDPRVLSLFVDIDGLAGKKVTDFNDVYLVFENMVSAVFDNKQLLQQVEGVQNFNVISKYYLLRANNIVQDYHLEPAYALPALAQVIGSISARDQYLLPSYFEKVMLPLAKASDGDTATFDAALLAFNGLIESRYPLQLNQLAFLTNQIRADFQKVFKDFSENIPQASKEMTHFELQDETRQRGEMADHEIYPPSNIYLQKPSIWDQMARPRISPGLQLRPPTDILANPQFTHPAQMPSGPFTLTASAEELHMRLDAPLTPMAPTVTRPSPPNAFKVTYLSRQRLLMAVRKAFDKMPLDFPSTMITAAGQLAGYTLVTGAEQTSVEETKKITTETTTTAGGIAGQGTQRFPMGGLMETVVGQIATTTTITTTTEVGNSVAAVKDITQGTGFFHEETAGGGVGRLAAHRQTFDYKGTGGGEHEGEYTMRMDTDTLFGVSKTTGKSLLVYVPEIYKDNTGKEVMTGKLYFMDKGDVWQIAVSRSTDEILKNFFYGSAETEGALASIMKYQPAEWSQGKRWQEIGGAIGFTLDPIAVFAMEDAIQKVNYSTQIVKDETTGLDVKQVDFTSLEAVGLTAIPLAMAFNQILKDGAIVLISRLAVPTNALTEPGKEGIAWEKGVYSGELIVKKIEPNREWEARAMAGKPGMAGALFKLTDRKGEHVTRRYGKASTSSYILWNDLIQNEKEAKQVANYVRTTMAEFYHWDENTAKKEGYFVGGSIMLGGIDATQRNFETMENLGWDNTFFAAIAGYYTQKFSLFGTFERTPAYMTDTFQLIGDRLAQMQADPTKSAAVAEQVTNELKLVTQSKIWRSVVGASYDPDNWTFRFITNAEVREPTDYGYSVIGGSVFVGYKRWIQPYGDLEAYTYAYPNAQMYQANMDIYTSIGASNITLSPLTVFDFEVKDAIPQTPKKLLAFLNEENTVIANKLFTKYYKLVGEGMPDLRFVFAPNLEINSEKAEPNYYALIEKGKYYGPPYTMDLDVKGALPETPEKLLAFFNENGAEVAKKLFREYYQTEEKAPELTFALTDNLKTRQKTAAPRYHLFVDKDTHTVYLGNENDRQKWELGGPQTYRNIFVVDADAKASAITIANSGAKSTAHIGNEEDRKKWVERGLNMHEDILVIGANSEKNTVTMTTASTKNTLWLHRMRLLGGPTLKIEPEQGIAGWTAGVLVDVFKDYKKNILLAAFAAQRQMGSGQIGAQTLTTAGEKGNTEFQNEDWHQYAVTLSSKWNQIDWTDMHDRIYGYIFINRITKEAKVVPPSEFSETMERFTGGTGWTWAFFDGLLGETSKLDIYGEAGTHKIVINGPAGVSDSVRDDFIFRAGGGYSHRDVLGLNWLTMQTVLYRGWWPIGQPTNITQPWLLGDLSQLWQLERTMKSPWGFMLFVGGQW
ncbi:MAG: hypothetical protein V1492_04085 [Candidatus Micrarchaeota archaeon]